jgi:hypothetical protein
MILKKFALTLSKSLFKNKINFRKPHTFFSTSTNIVTIQEAKQMVKAYNCMSNEILLTLAAMGDQEAREERVIREIMAVDQVW